MPPTDPYLLERLRNIMNTKKVPWYEKRMFGGVCFMVDEKMCFGTYQGGLMGRTEPAEMDELTQRPGCTPMLHGGRTMKGYIALTPEAYDSEEDLEFWIDKCLEFNPKAKASKKRAAK